MSKPRSHALLQLTAVAAFCVCCVVNAACSGSTSDVGGSAVDGGGNSDSATGSDSAAPPADSCAADAGIGCNTLGYGSVVTPTCGQGTAPASTGGTIAEGSYVLTARVEYGSDCASHLDVLRGAAGFHAGVLDFAADNDPPCKDLTSVNSKQRQSWMVAASGTSVSGAETCDTAPFGLSSGNTWSFTATATTLVLVNDSTMSTYALAP